MNKQPIIILEGPDCSGKTTLANKLMEIYPNHVYIHCAVTSDIKELHERAIANAKYLSKDFCVIIDRLHLSEQIYSKIYRNGPAYDTQVFDRELNNIPNLYKILVITDKITTLWNHKNRLEKEMFTSNMEKVWDEYDKIDNWKRYNYQIHEKDFNLEDYRA